MEQLKQLSIFSENKPGRLKKITRVLAEEGVNILAINIASSDGFGVIRFIVDKSDAAFQKLKQKGFTVSLNEVLAIELVDRPGGLYEVATILSQKKNQYRERLCAYFRIQKKGIPYRRCQ